MRKRFLLKLSLRTLDQLKALIFVCPCHDEKHHYPLIQALNNI